jgi:hypothetical protein
LIHTLGFIWQRGEKFLNLNYINNFRRPYEDKPEAAPLFPPSSSMSPSSAPISSTTATINRTLLHSQQYTAHGIGISGGGGGGGGGMHHARNGHAARQGLATHFNQGDSPPPTYDDVHDISLQRHGFFFLSFYSFPHHLKDFLFHLLSLSCCLI